MLRTLRRNGPLALLCLVIVLAAGLYASRHHRDDRPAPSTSTATAR